MCWMGPNEDPVQVILEDAWMMLNPMCHEQNDHSHDLPVGSMYMCVMSVWAGAHAVAASLHLHAHAQELTAS